MLKEKLIAFSILALSGCASPGLDYLVPHPASNAEAAKLRSVAVMEFSGEHGHVFTSSMDAMLRSATFENYPWFEVSPYTRRAEWFGTNTQDAIEMGRDLEVEGVWFGNVYSDSDYSYPYLEERSRCVEWDGLFDCETRERYDVECFDIDADIEVHAMLVSVATGQVVANRTLHDSDDDKVCHEVRSHHGEKHNKKYKRKGYHDGGRTSDRAYRMESRLVASQASRLRNEIAPFEATVRATLMETPSTPYAELNAGFASALSDAKGGRNLAACRRYESMYEQFPEDAALIYNLGACAEMFGEFEHAAEHYEKAYGMAGPYMDKDFSKIAGKAFNRIQDLRTKQSYLMDQLN